MYKYNKNDNITKELVWSMLPLVTGKTWVRILAVAPVPVWGLVLSPMGLESRINKKYRF